MSAYRNCKFCHGRGCVGCEGERERAMLKASEPVFVAHNEDDLQLLKGAIGKDAIDRAYAPGGGGPRELHFNLLLARLNQAERKAKENEEEKP